MIGMIFVIIYLDIVLAISTYCHWIILQLTDQLVRLNTKWYRILIGSLVASSIIPLTLFYPHSFFSSWISIFILSIVTILSTFGIRHIRSIGKIVFTFYFATFIIGGGLLALYFVGYFTQHYVNGIASVNIYNEKVNGLFVVIGAPFMLFFIRYLMKKFARDQLDYDRIYRVKVNFNGQGHETNGFIDSGNQLMDPISGRPVAVCDEAFIKKFFSNKDWTQIKTALTKNNLDLLPNNVRASLYVIPFHTVDGKSQVIYTLKPQAMSIYYQGKQLNIKRVLIGINWTYLKADQRYECLIHPEMVHTSINKSA